MRGVITGTGTTKQKAIEDAQRRVDLATGGGRADKLTVSCVDNEWFASWHPDLERSNRETPSI